MPGPKSGWGRTKTFFGVRWESITKNAATKCGPFPSALKPITTQASGRVMFVKEMQCNATQCNTTQRNGTILVPTVGSNFRGFRFRISRSFKVPEAMKATSGGFKHLHIRELQLIRS